MTAKACGDVSQHLQIYFEVDKFMLDSCFIMYSLLKLKIVYFSELIASVRLFEQFLHEKNGFEISENLAGYKSKNNF